MAVFSRDSIDISDMGTPVGYVSGKGLHPLRAGAPALVWRTEDGSSWHGYRRFGSAGARELAHSGKPSAGPIAGADEYVLPLSIHSVPTQLLAEPGPLAGSADSVSGPPGVHGMPADPGFGIPL